MRVRPCDHPAVSIDNQDLDRVARRSGRCHPSREPIDFGKRFGDCSVFAQNSSLTAFVGAPRLHEPIRHHRICLGRIDGLGHILPFQPDALVHQARVRNGTR